MIQKTNRVIPIFNNSKWFVDSEQSEVVGSESKIQDLYMKAENIQVMPWLTLSPIDC